MMWHDVKHVTIMVAMVSWAVARCCITQFFSCASSTTNIVSRSSFSSLTSSSQTISFACGDILA